MNMEALTEVLNVIYDGMGVRDVVNGELIK